MVVAPPAVQPRGVGTCSQEQYPLDGTYVLTWQLHLVVGWDPTHGDYRATIADNYGRDRFTLVTTDDGPMQQRMTWDATYRTTSRGATKRRSPASTSMTPPTCEARGTR